MLGSRETKSSVYLMHKYWGKKPAGALREIIERYSAPGDLILDPFAGYGGVAIEGLLLNRNVTINDLNPAAVFIARCVLDETADLDVFWQLFCDLKERYAALEAEWYSYHGARILAILRDKHDTPLRVRIRQGQKCSEHVLTPEEQTAFLRLENGYEIPYWFPLDSLPANPRINVKPGQRVCDLFSKRALICHSYLYSLIGSLKDCPEKELLRLAFTSNLANCSKLVPPIRSRGEMSAGAWMTGFYIGETYLENNVFHYFENRVAKILRGKADFLAMRRQSGAASACTILWEDAKKLSVGSDSVDFVLTDFPYGDTVPYFELSRLWNAWLKYPVDYQNEIVISDSPERKKDLGQFGADLKRAVGEICRTLKEGKYFVFTFHSLQGKEWSAILQALSGYPLQFVDCDVMAQKTLPPRQLNRLNSIKGDIVAVYKKVSERQAPREEFGELLWQNLSALSRRKGEFGLDEIIAEIVRSMLEANFSEQVEFDSLIAACCTPAATENHWRLKDELYPTRSSLSE